MQLLITQCFSFILERLSNNKDIFMYALVYYQLYIILISNSI